ncbi:hypothetical protein GWO43_28420 [candidate division KSB1 bacterium]|nr:hypothetical protein [candidate division KSB1 bacterium]NIR70820.1 hypothetical protein [candidate division KSB1 bacterium]NIS27832.1 hypothetical protein [candidate division KSB1 bacterium]NIT74714.1 hypothetical protein [candidate division KSB1 bacterium]NIU28497.1 hypothetical protein [candidate division KSB1 bacterium]
MQANKVGILSAIVASICCVGPLLLILVGLGSLGFGAFFGKYHGLFSGAGLAILVFAWTLYFREKRRCAAEQCDMRNKKVTQTTLTVATLAVLFFLGANLYTYSGGLFGANSTRDATIPAQLEQVTIPVEGMTCFTCEISVEHAAKGVDGVFQADASTQKKSVTIEYDPDKTSVPEIVDAVNATGYRAQMPTSK